MRSTISPSTSFRFDAARLDFINAVNKKGNDELVAQIKEVYSEIIK